MKVVYTLQIKQDCQNKFNSVTGSTLLSVNTKLSAIACVSRRQVQNARWFLSRLVALFTYKGTAPGDGRTAVRKAGGVCKAVEQIVQQRAMR
jgi:hypothetical protein